MAERDVAAPASVAWLHDRRKVDVGELMTVLQVECARVRKRGVAQDPAAAFVASGVDAPVDIAADAGVGVARPTGIS